jgi:hypothetical protein
MSIRLALLLALGTSLACAEQPEKAELPPPVPTLRLTWASVLGGAGVDDCDDVAVHAGSLVLACHSASNDFPGSNARDPSRADVDAYIVKVDPAAGKVLWATRVGGWRYDGAFRIRLDEAGGIWVAGHTESNDFPVTSGAAQRRFGGGESDGFIARLDAAGQVVYASFVGGSGPDQAIDLAVEPLGHSVHVIGMTASPNLPAAKNRPTKPGKQDGFVARLDLAKPVISRTLYLAGTDDDRPTSIVRQADGHILIAGYTLSKDFPVKAAYQAKHQGKNSAFMARVNAATYEVRSSTFFGGSGQDSVYGVALGPSGDVYVFGMTTSRDFPTSSKVFQYTGNGGFDTFVARFDPTVQLLRFSTYFGGSGSDVVGVDGKNLAVDSEGRAWFVGMTHSKDLKLRDAHQSAFAGGDGDGFIAALSPDGRTLEYASYHGSPERDMLEGIAIGERAVYATGVTFGRVAATGPQLPSGSAGNAMLIRLRPR